MSDLLLEMTRHIKDIERAIERLAGVEVMRPMAARIYNDANQSINDSAITVVGFNSERYDTHAQHFASAANLTGTVTKTVSSTTLEGSGTAFTTELSIGQVISVPGTATEVRVVTFITDDTHLTVAVAFANNASGQTATRVNSALVCRQAGKYPIEAGIAFAANATGFREALLRLNGVTTIGRVKLPAVAVAGEATVLNVSMPGPWQLNEWDYVEVLVQQTSGGALNVLTLASESPEFGWARVA